MRARRLLGVGRLVLLTAVLTAQAHAASLSLDRGPVVLGKTESVGVTIRVDERPGTEERPLRLSVNVGSFGEVTRVGPGVYRAKYMPPTTRFPQVALVAAWRETGPDAPIEFLRIPLYGATKIDVSARPRSSVVVRTGLDEFGPVVTNARGNAVVPVLVPPNIPEATIHIKEKSGHVTTRKSVVAVPPYNRLTLALVPHALVANGEDWARLEVLYDAGADVPPERIKLQPSLGTATLLRTERGGRYVYRYVPPAGTTAPSVSFRVGVEGDPIASAVATLSLGLPPAAAVTIAPPDKSLSCDGHSSAPVSVKVFDANGMGLPQQRVELFANGQPLQGLHYAGNGVYQARLVAPATYPAQGLVQLSAVVHRPGQEALTATANYQVLASPVPQSVHSQVTPSPLLADGSSRAMVSLDVRDGAGLPLTGAKLILLTHDGTVGPVTELGDGRYRAEYIAPSRVPPGGEALVKVVDASGTFEKAMSIPLRKRQRLLIGPRVGLTHSLGDLAGARLGLDLWAPLRLGDVHLALGASAMFQRAAQTVTDGSGALSSRSEATLVPVTVRLGYELVASRWASAHLGVGGVATWAKVRNSLNGYEPSRIDYGGLGFVAGALLLGPGQLFAELSYAYAPVEHPDFRLQAGGVGLGVGYRLGLF